MLVEYKKVSQKEKGIIRRWFEDYFFDLIIWYNEKNEKIGFQLCYDVNGKEKAITMKGEYYIHNRVDQGDELPGMNMTPVLVQDGVFKKDEILERFIKESKKIDIDIVNYVIEGIQKY
jgi:hypothetical protein